MSETELAELGQLAVALLRDGQNVLAFFARCHADDLSAINIHGLYTHRRTSGCADIIFIEENGLAIGTADENLRMSIGRSDEGKLIAFAQRHRNLALAVDIFKLRDFDTLDHAKLRYNRKSPCFIICRIWNDGTYLFILGQGKQVDDRNTL